MPAYGIVITLAVEHADVQRPRERPTSCPSTAPAVAVRGTTATTTPTSITGLCRSPPALGENAAEAPAGRGLPGHRPAGRSSYLVMFVAVGTAPTRWHAVAQTAQLFWFVFVGLVASPWPGLYGLLTPLLSARPRRQLGRLCTWSRVHVADVASLAPRRPHHVRRPLG